MAALALLLAGFSAPALAAKHRHHAAAVPTIRGLGQGRARVRMPVSPTDPVKDAALIVDGATGKVIYGRNETAERHPASLTKMMTLYLLFDALKAGKVTMSTQMPVSYHASIQKPTKLSLRPGQTIDVDTAIRAIVIRSANDVAVVIAEALGGTESHFAEMMTARARQLGMRETNYHNASGLPDPLQISTATDLAMLGRHLAYDYPQYFPYFGLAGFQYKGAWYPTHDNLIGRYEGADGIKTGYTGASGFNLVSSITRGTAHVIAVVMGGRTAVRRDLEMVRLLDQTFAQISANPNLVARASVPWRQVAQNGPAPAMAGFNLPQVVSSGQYLPNMPLVSSGQYLGKSVPSNVQSDDEDAAESVRAPDENFSLIHAEGPKPAAQAPAPQPKPAPQVAAPQPVPAVAPLVAKNAAPAPAIRPGARPDPVLAATQAQLVKTAAVAPAAVNAPRPQMRPSLRDDAGEGDVDVTPSPGHNWTIQIGAYADKALADAQLKTYAGKAQDVLARASRIIAPITSARGHTLYRARFGLFAEQEAREVCNRLTQRGQTCFAAVQTR
ncbi:MAG: D-alanyl-D-alanine carboxypeptidase [Alphaproteobacteria bacterium]|nr:D-alanyl-D-alanine carboxypeptidase [Alphaproteobacteria bacterium]